MSTAVFLRNVVGVSQEILRIAVCPLHGDFYINHFTRIDLDGLVDVEDVVMNLGLTLVDKFNKALNTAGILENFIFSCSHISKMNLHAVI